MVYTPIEIIALVLITVSVIKILILLVNPKSWMNFARMIYKNSRVTSVVALILAVVVLFYLIQELTIIQILAVTSFVALLFVIGLADRGNALIKMYEGQIKNKTLWKRNLFYTLIWIALLAWGIKVLFF